MPKNAKITISKVRPGDGDEYMQIEIRFDENGERHQFRADVEMLDFAHCITGQAHMPCKVKKQKWRKG
jgi:hypothetical protein